MKNWIKVIIGLSVGLVLGILVPVKIPILFAISKFFATLAINIGRYVLMPYIFFSFAVEVSELYRNKKLLSSFLIGLSYMLATLVILVVTGIALTLLLSPTKIFYIFSDLSTIKIPTFSEFLLSIYPKNILDVFFNSNGIVIPILIAALIIGINFSFDRIITKPIVQIFDSFSKILNNINKLAMELLGISSFFLSAFFIMQLRNNQKIGQDLINLTIYILIEVALVIFIIYPIILLLFFKIKNPYKVIFALFIPSAIAFFSGDVLYAHSTLYRFNERNLGINNIRNNFFNSLYAGFFRAGTAMISASVFLVILKSQSSLTINLSSILATFILSVVLSFYTGTIPVYGVFFTIVVMCQNYTVIKNDAYNLIIPILPILYGFSALLDTISSSLCTMLITKREKVLKDIDVADFI